MIRMRVSPKQVAETLAALRSDQIPGRSLQIDRAPIQLDPALIERLSGPPAVRRDWTERARAEISANRLPTDEDLAAMLVGRLVCDRLR